MATPPAPRCRLALDIGKCVGHGRCYDLAPDLFAPCDDEGRAKLLVAEVEGGALSRAELAVQSCPEGAIALFKNLEQD